MMVRTFMSFFYITSVSPTLYLPATGFSHSIPVLLTNKMDRIESFSISHIGYHPFLQQFRRHCTAISSRQSNLRTKPQKILESEDSRQKVLETVMHTERQQLLPEVSSCAGNFSAQGIKCSATSLHQTTRTTRIKAQDTESEVAKLQTLSPTLSLDHDLQQSEAKS